MKLLKTDDTFILTDEQLLERATQVITAAADKNTKESVILIFEAISLPFSGKNYKRQLFELIFKLSEIEAKWDKNLGFMVLSEHRTKRTVVSHMDLIPSFNKGFKNNKVYKIEDEKLIGALDNTFTNAVVINSILNKQAKDTSYLFTLDEETTQHAIRDYMKRFGKEQFIINLDVTNDGLKNNMSIEYDEPCWSICKQINDNMDNPFFTIDRVGDDLDEVLKANGFGFSYCIPTEKKIHSYNNFTYLNKIEPYMLGLEFLVHELDVCVMCQDIDHLDIYDAIDFESFDEMKEKDVYTRTSYEVYETDTHLNYADEDPVDMTKDDKKILKFANMVLAIAAEKYPGSYLGAKDFLNHSLYGEDVFTIKELLSFMPEDFFFELLSLGLIVRSYEDKYEFNLQIVKTSEFKIYNILAKYKTFNSIEFYRLIQEHGINEFSYDELFHLETTNKVQNLTAPITELLKKGFIKKEKNNDMFKILT